MDKVKSGATWFMGIAMCYLATSLLFTAFEIRNMRKDVPVILEQFETMDTTLDIAGILTTINNVNDQIPSILAEVKGTRETLDSINKQMPSVVSEVSALRQTTIPAVIKESEAIRAAAPDLLDKADKTATKLGKIPQDMAKNVTTGAVKSVVSAPSDIVKGVGKGVGDGITGGLNLLKKKKPVVEETIKEDVAQ